MSIGLRFSQWLFQTGRPDPSPIVLRQRRIFIVPSPTGLLFAIVLIAMYLGAVNYNLGLGHALVFLLVGLGHTGLVHCFRNLYCLRILPGRVSPVFAGETASFTVRFENDRPSERPALAIKTEAPAATIQFAVPASGAISVSIPLPTQRRGWHALGRLRLSTTYPLGLFHAWSYPRPEMRCLVYPRPISHPLPLPQAGEKPGISGLQPGEDDFAGFRARQPGDSPRHVAWKAFARDPENRPLLVKQFTGAAEPELWLGWDMLAPGLDTETRLSILAGWVLAADAEGARYGLRLPDHLLAPGHGEGQLAAALRALALFGIEP